MAGTRPAMTVQEAGTSPAIMSGSAGRDKGAPLMPRRFGPYNTPTRTRGRSHPMITPRLDQLGDYAFRRLEQLLAGITPATNEPPLKMSVGEPQHQPPALLAETLAANAHLWNRYPPVAGTPEWRSAVADWLTKRYALPAGLIDPATQLLPAAGTREALFMVSLLCVHGAKT